MNAPVKPPRPWQLGDLSAQAESKGGVGTVSSGKGDPGGISYGTFQLASKTGTAADFAKNEGKPFVLVGLPGSPAFSASWRSAAQEDPKAFGDAQRAYIRRTHYDPAVRLVVKATGCNLDARGNGVRDAVWSCAVQHGGAAAILIDALHDVGTGSTDVALLHAIYARRSSYVRGIAGKTTNIAMADQLRSVVQHRYPGELQNALAIGRMA